MTRPLDFLFSNRCEVSIRSHIPPEQAMALHCQNITLPVYHWSTQLPCLGKHFHRFPNFKHHSIFHHTSNNYTIFYKDNSPGSDHTKILANNRIQPCLHPVHDRVDQLVPDTGTNIFYFRSGLICYVTYGRNPSSSSCLLQDSDDFAPSI